MTTITDLLTPGSSADPRDRERLLAHVLKKPREWVIAHPEALTRPASAARYRRLLRRLERGEPLAYLLGEQWFYGRPFTVNRNVLIPRPETELLVELAIRRIKNQESRIMGFQILDIGTGSGCIAITLAAELSHASVIAIDTSPTALRVARTNARRNGVAQRIKFRRGNLLDPLKFILSGANAKRRISQTSRDDRPDRSTTRLGEILRRPAPQDKLLILANLPYLTTKEWRALPRSLRSYEPRQAFDGGPDGLKHFRALFGQLKKLSTLNSQLSTLLEVDPRRKRALSALIRKTLPGWRASWHRDLSGRYRVLSIQY